MLIDRIDRIERILEEIQEILAEHLSNPAKPKHVRKIQRLQWKDLPPGFRQFIETYRRALEVSGRRLAHMKQALDVWKRRNLEAHAGAICDRVDDQIDRYIDKKKSGEFCPAFPDPHRYLRDSRWNDE